MRLRGGSRIPWIPVVVACFTGGCGSPQYDTPEATFETAKAAVASYDCQTFCSCLTPQARDETAAGLIIYGGFVQLRALLPGPDAERIRLRAAKIKAVFHKHGFRRETAPKISLNLSTSEKPQRPEMLELVEPIKDRNAFIGDFMRVLIETADKPDARLIEPNARLLDLKIENDTATARFAQTRQGQEKTSPIKFKKVDGKWKISKVPNLVG